MTGIRSIFVGLALSLALAWAQTSKSTVSGVVRNESQAPVRNAKVVVVGKATGVAREAVSDAGGRYTIANLDPGTYELRAEATGFAATVVDKVGLLVGGTTISDVLLRSNASASAPEVVTYREPVIDIASVDLNRVIPGRTIDTLPNRGRNFVDFVKLSSGVGPGRENVSGGPFKEPDTGVGASAAPRLSFGGQSELHTKIQVDGADNVQTFTGLSRATPSQEAAAEFRVLNSTYRAEYGGALGGFVNIVTKSGGNQLHGSAYYYGSNEALNASPLLNPSGFVLKQNQFGGTVSGPVAKDRSFFFLNYEGQRRQQSNTVSKVILSNLDVLNRVRTQYGLSPEVDNQARSSNYDLGLVKVDHRFGERNFAALRFNRLESEALRFPGVGRGSGASSASRNTDSHDYALVANLNSIVSGTVVNEARWQWAARDFHYTPVIFEPAVEIANLITMGKTTSEPDYYRETRAQLSDNLLISRGAHQIKMGFDFSRIGDETVFPLFFPARIVFANLTAFSSMSPVVFWYPTLKGSASMPAISTKWTSEAPDAWRSALEWAMPYNAYGAFWQDEWRATRRLTLTYGVRYDVETFPSLYLSQTDRNNLQPRLGVAWALTPETAVRAGWGLFHDRLASSVGQVFPIADWSSRGSLPDARSLFPTVAPLPGRFWQNTIVGPAAPAAAVQFLRDGQYPTPTQTGFADNMDSRMRTPYASHFSVEFERHLARGLTISASYLHVGGELLVGHTPNLNTLQTGVLTSGKPLLSGRRFASLGDFALITNANRSNYHGGTVQARRQFKGRFGIVAGYTFSKTMSTADSVTNMGDMPESNRIESEYALSRQHLAHRFTSGLLFVLPRRAGPLRGFQVSSLMAFESGRPFNIYTGSDANADGNPNSDRPGALGRNTLMGPGYAAADVRLAREFRLGESSILALTVDAFNLCNRINVKDLNTVWGGVDLNVAPNPLLGFGTPRDVFNAREVQYSLKLSF